MTDTPQNEKHPNIVLLTHHDAGDWFGCYGYDTVDTPAADRLAAEGGRFTSHFSACSICSPSRAAIATGLHCQRNGLMTLSNKATENRIHSHLTHVNRRFRDLGYRTALFGVQHEAAHEHVEAVLGVEEQFATDPWPNGDLQSPYVARWLRERRDDTCPFFAQIGTIDCHLNRFYSGRPPRTDEPCPPVVYDEKGVHMPEYLVGSKHDHETVRHLQGGLRRADRVLGAVLKALDDAGLAGNTIVCMCVDHGVGLARAKTHCYDAGNRVAWIVRYPGRIAPGTVVNALSGHVDVLPTLLELAGQDIPSGLDGHSLAAHLAGESSAEKHDAVFSFMVDSTRAIRTREHLLVRNFLPPRVAVNVRADCAGHWDELNEEPREGDRYDPNLGANEQYPLVELYDRIQDPHQLTNLADDPALATVREHLDAQLWDFLLDTDDFLVHAPVRNRWQRQTRDALEAHCRQAGRPTPLVDGPLASPLDAATARGEVAAGWEDFAGGDGAEVSGRASMD